MKQNRVEWLENITATWVKVKVKSGTLLLGIIGLILLQGCSEKNGLNTKDEVLISAYIEILEARRQPIVGPDSLKVIDSLLAKHGFSTESFKDAIRKRSAEPDKWTEFYQEVTRRLEEAEKKGSDSTTTNRKGQRGSF